MVQHADDSSTAEPAVRNESTYPRFESPTQNTLGGRRTIENGLGEVKSFVALQLEPYAKFTSLLSDWRLPR